MSASVRIRVRLAQLAGLVPFFIGLTKREKGTLDKHLEQINTEANGLQSGIEAAERALSAEDRAAQLRPTKSLLAMLRTKLAGAISPEMKRRIVEILVERVEANTVERFGVQQSEITSEYRFSQAEEPVVLVLPRSHRVSTRDRIPEKLETIRGPLVAPTSYA